LAGRGLGEMVAFVGGLGAFLGGARASACGNRCALRMGYGDYSYSTDKTQGHTRNYYIDKFRVPSDFGSMGSPTQKSTDGIPAEGIAQLEGPLARQPGAPEDPRVLEASGAIYPWDPNYVDPETALESLADVDDDDVADSAFQQFRAASAAERGSALSTFSIAAEKRDKIFQMTFSEKRILTLSGQLENEGARLAKKKSFPMFTPSGQPQTEIPGKPFMDSIGAADYIDMSTDVAKGEYKSAMSPEEPKYKIGGGSTPSAPALGSGQKQLGSA